MNEAQTEMLKKYENDCICIDSTYGTNANSYEMSTLLLLDDTWQVLPCNFLVKRLGITVHAIIQLIKHKHFYCLIVMGKGKVTNKP